MWCMCAIAFTGDFPFGVFPQPMSHHRFTHSLVPLATTTYILARVCVGPAGLGRDCQKDQGYFEQGDKGKL